MSNRLILSLSPHDKGDERVEKIMWGVVIALTPALLSSLYYFGWNALRVVVLGMLFCMGTEFVVQKFMMKQKTTALDGSAAVTGLLLSFNVPATIPWWQLLVGSIVAVGIAKMAFGGLGKNPFNPALVGRAFMLASFPVHMTTWPVPLKNVWSLGVDAVSAATPLGALSEGGTEALTGLGSTSFYLDLFLGRVGGCIGETAAVAILLGGIYMLYRRIITWHIPVVYLASLAATTGVFWMLEPEKYADPLFHVLAGGAMLGAWFMATDMVTSPMTVKGQIIFALGGGFICGLIRLFGAYPEGCSYSILIMNAFVPLIDGWSKPRRFGREVKHG